MHMYTTLAVIAQSFSFAIHVSQASAMLRSLITVYNSTLKVLSICLQHVLLLIDVAWQVLLLWGQVQ